ncbi:MAG: copper-translocating P-type ATPase [Dehalococcoidia bacterium]|nr:copper-translocating P-type ATPase [Dehalococcoidia bacterium]
MEVAVTVGIVVAGLLVARLHLHHRQRASLTVDGYQKARVVINGRYRPDMLRVQQGVPVRLRFLRREDNPCSERVIFAGFGIDRRLPAFQETTVEFVPTVAGTFLFTCQWGMYRGSLVVTAPRGGPKSPRAIKSEESMAEAKERTYIKGQGIER